MPAVFSMKVGQVGRVTPTGKGVVAFTIDFEDNRRGTFIVTEVGIRQGVNAQFLHTLDDAIYIYIFGDRIGDIIISGIAFIEVCGTGASGSGVKNVMTYYADNKASQRSGPVLVKFGDGEPFKSYLLESSVNLLKPEMGAAQFTFNFKLMPQRSRKNSGSIAQSTDSINRGNATAGSIA